MGKKVIRFGLSEREISKAIRELEQYKQEIIQKTDLLRERVAERIAELSRSGFAGAIVDDLVKGGGRAAQVDVKIDNRENVTIVIASGEDAVWVEFGAGIHHNGGKGMIGKSPNPYGEELHLTIGSFGENGKKEAWGFYDEGELKITYGTPAKMPMYRAVQTVTQEIVAIAREVFK